MGSQTKAKRGNPPLILQQLWKSQPRRFGHWIPSNFNWNYLNPLGDLKMSYLVGFNFIYTFILYIAMWVLTETSLLPIFIEKTLNYTHLPIQHEEQWVKWTWEIRSTCSCQWRWVLRTSQDLAPMLCFSIFYLAKTLYCIFFGPSCL